MLLNDSLLFLGEIPRHTDFEKGFPKMHYEENRKEKWDPIDCKLSLNFSKQF
jgi:7,8-dihydropterin-6-yl-methyl-4-(beta-D-ribofuranosyl)aminobenzene 5'-phosphate synthase